MDGHTQLDASLDRVEHDRMVDAIAAATTWQEVEEIRKTCQHKYAIGSHECRNCGHVQTDAERALDNIPF